MSQHSESRRPGRARAIWVKVHRYAGLSLALFLILSGLTGSVIAFNHELDAWLNPALFQAPSQAPPLTALELAGRVEAAEPRVRVSYLPLRLEPGKSLDLFVEPRIDPASGQPYALDYNELFVDPATGDVLGRRLWGQCCFEREHLLPFLYSLHYSLHLPENIGLWVVGLVGIVWLFDSFVGFYLTLPRGGPFFRRWRTAWTIKRDAGVYRRNFDLHRAGGLWTWALLIILAFSGVTLALGDQVIRPLVGLFSPLTPEVYHEREEALGGRLVPPTMSRERVVAAAGAEARRRGWEEPLDGLFYSSTAGLYGVGVGDHHGTGLGSRYLYFDGRDGQLVGAHLPGEGSAGDVLLQLQFPLHSGQIGGLATRILVSLTGLVVAMLSVTGVVIWTRKRTRRAGRERVARVEQPSYS